MTMSASENPLPKCFFCGGEQEKRFSGQSCPSCFEAHGVENETNIHCSHLTVGSFWARLNFTTESNDHYTVGRKENTTQVFEDCKSGYRLIATLDGFPITPANMKDRVEKLRAFL